jgi:hypothetical protein
VFGNYGFLKKNQSRSYLNHLVLNFMKICPVEAELFRADGRMDRCDEADAFLNFAKTFKKLEKKSKEHRMQNICIYFKTTIPYELTSELKSWASL